MAESFERARGELADRLVDTLAAAQRAGGDRRGQQSAALLVVRDKGGYAGFNDRYLDLRVDDHPSPIERLREILALHHLYFRRPNPDTLIPIDTIITRELQRIARQCKHFTGPITGKYDAATRQAVEALVGTENLEERWQPDMKIDPVVLDFLQKAYPAKKRSTAKTKSRAKANSTKRRKK